LGLWKKNIYRRYRRMGSVAVMAAALLLLPFARPVAAQNDPLNAPFEVVKFGENDTLRGVVGQYLRDPDLWPNVLKLNGIASPADLVPGTELKLPVKQVLAADTALIESLNAIQTATAEGARIFAPSEIGDAIENRDTALSRREDGDWRQVVSFAGAATDFANQALDIAIAQRDRSAEAVVSDVQGTVEGRAPAEPRWSGREMNDMLVEFERLRTLSGSTTQITFRDLSRLRLNPNSNATIQRMRSDPLTGGEVTKVSLVNGDFYALLNQLSDKTSFEIEVPGVETTTNSADFWIKNDASGARFVNYDEPDLEITQDGSKIMLGENEGVVLSGRGAERAEVLDSPLLVAPGLGQILYSTVATLDWGAFEGAEGYWLEVATDPGFNQMEVSEWGIRETTFETPELAPARYHWRVAVLDRLGLPGQWSKAQDFTVRVDRTPPFLTLLSPGPGIIASVPQIDILGATEPDAKLLLNGAPLEIGTDGSFVTIVPLAPGPNTIELKATDPAGNQSDRTQIVIFRPEASVDITLSDEIARVGDVLATRSNDLSVSGRTSALAGAGVAVRNAAGEVIVRTVIGANGDFRFTVPVDEAVRDYKIEVLAPSGRIEGNLDFTGVQDRTAPVIKLDLPLPKATGEAELEITGTVGDAVAAELDGRALDLADGRFATFLDLSPGVNGFDLVATDATGNVTIARLETLYDIEPPEVLSVDVRRPDGNAGPIQIEVVARDASGLRQAAPFVIEIGNNEREGFLRCDAASGVCRINLPPEPGNLRLIEVVIEDYAGNAAFE